MISLLLPSRSAPAVFAANAFVAFGPDGKPGAGGEIRQSRVLVVEDDYFVSMEIETVLLDMGCDVVGIAATGEEAIETAAREQPDVVLMDIRLAGSLDGIEAAKQIHAELGIRSLFVTSHSDPETRQRGEQASPVGWASKPFTSHQLTAAVQTALKTVRPKL